MPETVTPPAPAPSLGSPQRPPARRALFYLLLSVYIVWMGALTVMWLTTVHRAKPLPSRQPLILNVGPDGNLVLPQGMNIAPGNPAPTTAP